MTETKSQTPVGVTVQRVGVALLTILMIAAIESRGGWYVFATATQADKLLGLPLAAVQDVAISLACAVLSFVGMWAAATKQDDERPQVRKQVFAMKVVALALLFVPHGPIWNLACAIEYGEQLKRWEVYAPSAENPEGSPAYQLALKKADSYDYGEQERIYAQADIEPPTKARFDFWAAVAAVVINILVMQTPRFRMATPITPAEREAMRLAAEADALREKRKLAAQKGAETRARNKAIANGESTGKIGKLFGQDRRTKAAS